VTLTNTTEYETLSYDLKWGPNGPWRRIVLGPGQSFNHHWDALVPFRPYVRFNAGLYGWGPWRGGPLEAYNASGPDDPGKIYEFYIDGQGLLCLGAVN
jgi:hypothetical protein